METKPDSLYRQFEIHTPIASRWPGWNLLAQSQDNLVFKVRLGSRAHTIEVGGEIWRLTGKIRQGDKVHFHVEGPSLTPAIFHTSLRTFEFRVEFANQTYFMRMHDSMRVLCDVAGTPIACVSNAWKDDDSSKNIKYWIHHSQRVSPLLLAVFFCMARGFDFDSEEGL